MDVRRGSGKGSVISHADEESSTGAAINTEVQFQPRTLQPDTLTTILDFCLPVFLKPRQ